MNCFFEKGKFTEEQLEQAIIELFQLQGYTYVHRESTHRQCDDILSEDDLCNYLLSQYKDLSDVELRKIIQKIELIRSSPLYAGNHETFWLVNEGFNLQRDDISKVTMHVNYIDYDHPENNIFRVVN